MTFCRREKDSVDWQWWCFHLQSHDTHSPSSVRQTDRQWHCSHSPSFKQSAQTDRETDSGTAVTVRHSNSPHRQTDRQTVALQSQSVIQTVRTDRQTDRQTVALQKSPVSTTTSVIPQVWHVSMTIHTVLTCQPKVQSVNGMSLYFLAKKASPHFGWYQIILQGRRDTHVLCKNGVELATWE